MGNGEQEAHRRDRAEGAKHLVDLTKALFPATQLAEELRARLNSSVAQVAEDISQRYRALLVQINPLAGLSERLADQCRARAVQLNPLAGLVAKIAEQRRAWVASIQAAAQKHRASLDQFVKNAAASLEHLAEQMERTWSALDEAHLWLFSQGWPPLYHTPLPVAVRLMEACQELEDDQIGAFVDKTIIEYHTPDLLERDILGDWRKRPCLESRLHILEAAVQAHMRGQYELSVPVVLCQMEGVIAGNFGHTGRLYGKKYKSYVEQVFAGDSLGNTHELMRKFILDHILGQFEHGLPVGFDLNRHAILHGADTAYNRESTSLKAVLVLDLIVNEMEFASIEGSNRFHRLDCAALRRSRMSRHLYAHEHQALGDGKEPCGLCCRKLKGQYAANSEEQK